MKSGDKVTFYYLGQIVSSEERLLESCLAVVTQVIDDDHLVMEVLWPEDKIAEEPSTGMRYHKELQFQVVQGPSPRATTDPPASGTWTVFDPTR